MTTESVALPRFSRTASFGLVALAYAVAFAAAAVVASAIGHDRPVLAVFAADVAATLIVYGFSLALGNGSVYDPYWSVVPPVIATYWVALAVDPTVRLRQLLVGVLVFAWAIRLTANWVRGWPGLHHEDWRYVRLYAEAGMPKWLISLLGIHLAPTLQVFLGCLPLVPALLRGSRPFGWLDLVACTVTAGAILIELIADEQLRAFNRTKQPGEIMTRGLWAYSRHPNYFGELSFWWGLFLFGLAAAPGAWWTGIGAVTMTAMFWFASIPMLDRRSCERRPAYAEHMQRVSALVPWWPRAEPWR